MAVEKARAAKARAEKAHAEHARAEKARQQKVVSSEVGQIVSGLEVLKGDLKQAASYTETMEGQANLRTVDDLLACEDLDEERRRRRPAASSTGRSRSSGRAAAPRPSAAT